MVSYISQANDVLRRVTGHGDSVDGGCIINPRPNSLQKLMSGGASLYRPLMEAVAQQRSESLEVSPWLNQQSSWQLPTTRRYQQSRQPPAIPLVQPVAGSAWMAETSRFPVSYGSVGIVKAFDQYASRGETVLTVSEHWGNPFPNGVSIRWFLRLSALSMLGAPWINSTGLSAIPDYLPGTPYDDFSRSDDIWFPTGSSSSANIHLAIPGGKVLRVCCIVSGSQETVRIASKLAGTIQTETNDDAQTVVRTTW